MTRDALLTMLACGALAVPAAATQSPVGPRPPGANALPEAYASPGATAYRLPPAPSGARGDTATVLYREARDLMAQGRHAGAAEVFGALAERHPDSEYAADAPYWQAFNLYRVDGEESLRGALSALMRQARVHPRAPTRQNGEAQALLARVQGRLASRGDETAARAVREAAQDRSCAEQDLETRTAALNALVQIGPEEAIPILREVLARQDACGLELRRRVPHLLSRLDEPEATDLLLEIARSDADPETRESAISYVGGLGSAGATDLLIGIARSNDEDPEIRAGAISALGVGRRSYRVVRVAGANTVVRGVVGGRPEGSVATRIRGRVGQAVPVEVGVRGEEPADEDPRIGQLFRDLAADASTPVELRRTAVRQLGRRDPDGLVPFLGEVFRTSPELRESIVEAVARSDRPEVMDWLLSVAADASVEEGVRQSAVHRAGRRDDPTDAYLSLYPDLELTSLRTSFLMGLAQREDAAAVDLLIRLAREEEDPEVRRSAIYWLGRSGDPRAAAVLREIIGG